MKTLKRFLTTALKLVVFAAIIVGGYYSYQTFMVEPEEDEIGELPTVEAAIRDITVSVSATGVLQPIRIVEIKSKASGEILQMPVEMGDFARAGDLIAQVDTRILDQEFKQVEADYESAKVRLQIADSQYERARSLHAEDLISENDLETNQQNFTNAEAQMLRAEASLELARERLEDATVTAPISGTIIAKTVEEGQIIASSTNNVSGGTVLINMADLSELEIRTLVDEIDIGQVESGLRVESTVEAFADMNFTGEVRKIEPQAVVQQSVTTFPVLSRIDNSEGLLLPGMNADVSIIVHQRPGVLAVANEAVRTPDDARAVIALLGLDATMRADTILTDDNGDGRDAQRPVDAAMSDNTVADDRHDDNGENGNSNGNNAGNNAGDGRRGHMADNSDGERARVMAEIRSARAGADAAAPDPWGTEGGRREEAVVFLLDENGQIVPRQIIAGIRDWEFTEVLSGLQPGDELVLLPSTSLLRSQQAMRDRFANRNSMISGDGLR